MKRDLLGHGACQDLARRVVAQALLHPQRDPRRVGVHPGELVGVAVGPIQRGAQQFGGGLVAGDHHQEQEREDLLVGEPVAADLGLQQRRGQVVRRGLLVLLDQIDVVEHQIGRGLHRRLRHVGEPVFAVQHPVGEFADARPVRLRHPHELGDDVHGEFAGELGDEIERAVGAVRQGGVEVGGGDLGHPRLQLAGAPRSEPLGDQGAQPQMLRVVEGEERHHLVGVSGPRDRVQGDPVDVGERGGVAEPRHDVGVARQRPEVQVVVVVQRGLVAQPPVVRERVLVEVVVVRIQQ